MAGVFRLSYISPVLGFDFRLDMHAAEFRKGFEAVFGFGLCSRLFLVSAEAPAGSGLEGFRD